MSLTERLRRLEQLRGALDLSTVQASGVSQVGELSDEDALRIRAAIQRVERGGK